MRLPPRFLGLQPGAKFQLDLSPSIWSVQQCTIDGFVAVVELQPSWAPVASIAANAGRILANPDTVAGALTLAMFDVPDVLEQGSMTPTVLLAASNASGTWKSRSVDAAAGGQNLQTQVAARKTTLGAAMSALPAGDAYLIDRTSQLDVALVDPNQWLLSCDDDALVNGANLAVLGSELLQFGSVESLGGGKFRLSNLLRGRGGTEWAMDSHAAGESFAMIDREALRAVTMPAWASGANVAATVRNVDGTTSSSTPLVLGGESLRPRSPVRFSAAKDSSGNLALGWIRRSRTAWAWLDEVDVPIGETFERYRVTLLGAANSLEIECSEPALRVSATQLASLGAGPATVQVRQIGDASASRPAECSITI